jgi:predicted aspartyl protease
MIETNARKLRTYVSLILGFTFLLASTSLFAGHTTVLNALIPMYEKGASTYYIKGGIRGLGDTEFMVDTGSGYVTINEHTLAILKRKGQATYVKKILARLADGQKQIYPVYLLNTIRLGKNCILKNIEAAVLPGKTRNILGLSGLKKTGGFSVTFEPPRLTLAACT